jgi:farnesyl-diphosphate farnesyltransferase
MNHGVDESEGARLEALLIKTSRTFALSIPELPEPTRREVTVAYLLFRVADTLEDATRWTPQRQSTEMGRLVGLLERPTGPAAHRLARDWLEEPPLGEDAYLELLSELPGVVAALESLDPAARETVSRHTLRTIEGMAAFVRRERPLQLRDIPDLQDYCYAVAGIVGEMLTELFLLGSPALETVAPSLRAGAAGFGEALQLVNILKDSASDVREGRSYLPQGVDRAEVFALARGDLEGAGRYVGRLQAAGAPRGVVAFTALPVLLARATLDRVARRGPGAKLTRPEVAEIARSLDAALDRGRPAIPTTWPTRGADLGGARRP